MKMIMHVLQTPVQHYRTNTTRKAYEGHA